MGDQQLPVLPDELARREPSGPVRGVIGGHYPHCECPKVTSGYPTRDARPEVRGAYFAARGVIVTFVPRTQFLNSSV